MSTQTTQAPSAPELPTTSHGEATAPPAESMSEWTYFDNTTNDETEQTETSAKQTTTTTTSETVNSTADNTASKTTTSTTYSFPGSALCSDSTANINNIKTETSPTVGAKNKHNEEEKVDDSMYECNICLDTAKDAVVSLCGHLFCWPCLHQWLETRPSRKLCPVCKAAIGKDKVIPLYGRNSTKQEDPR